MLNYKTHNWCPTCGKAILIEDVIMPEKRCPGCKTKCRFKPRHRRGRNLK